MIKSNLHTHTYYCDGKCSPLQMVEAGISKNFTTLGFSFHAYTPFDLSYCIKNEDKYLQEIEYLKNKYSSKINILSGIEQDYYSKNNKNLDFVIGSVHYLKIKEKYYPIDENIETLILLRDNFFSGNIYKLLEEYYDTVIKMVLKIKPTIIGHFDLISKFNKDKCLFDENSIEYKNIINSTLDKIENSFLFEVNTGGINRGRGVPYPSCNILKKLLDRGYKVTISSDAHNDENLDYGFYETIKILKEIGFKTIVAFNGKKQVLQDI